MIININPLWLEDFDGYINQNFNKFVENFINPSQSL